MCKIDRPTGKDEKFIPPGSYCCHFLQSEGIGAGRSYVTLTCPYLELHPEKPKQESGYCHYLECGDWEENGTFLLWDMVKECSVKFDPNEDDLTVYYTATKQWATEMLPLIADGSYKEKVIKWIEWLKSEIKVLES